jgi:hypothetical protein
VKLKPPQVNFVLDSEDQSLVPSSFKIIPYKKFSVESSSSSKTKVVSSTNGHQATVKGDKKSSRRLSVAERLLQSQMSISPMKNEVQDGKIAEVKMVNKYSLF